MNKADYINQESDRSKAAAFTEIYDRLFPRLFWFAMSFLQNRENAEDVVADVFEKLWNLNDQLDSIEHIDAYLRKMTTNSCLDFLKRDKLKADIYHELAGRIEEAIESTFELAEIKANVHRFYQDEVIKLSPNYKRVFKLSLLNEEENEAVAAQLKLSNQAVRKMKQNLRKMLRKRFPSLAVVSLLACLFIQKLLAISTLAVGLLLCV